MQRVALLPTARFLFQLQRKWLHRTQLPQIPRLLRGVASHTVIHNVPVARSAPGFRDPNDLLRQADGLLPDYAAARPLLEEARALGSVAALAQLSLWHQFAPPHARPDPAQVPDLYCLYFRTVYASVAQKCQVSREMSVL